VGVCDPVAVACLVEPRTDGTFCGSSATEDCSARDTCQQGQCVDNDAPQGTPCDDQNLDCLQNDTCDGDGRCVDNGFLPENTPCGDQGDNDCTDPNTCDALGVCQPNHAPADSLCGDVGVLCRNDDRCDGLGECIDSGNWALGQCPMGEVDKDNQGYCLCGSDQEDLCHPGPDVCIDGTCRLGHEQFAPSGGTTDGTPCGNATPTNAQCDNPDVCRSGLCDANGEMAGTACGDQSVDTICNAADECDGFGNCSARLAPTTTICDDDLPGECWLQPRCDGLGSCAAAAPAPPLTACGSGSETTCDHADVCDGAGDCDPNYASNTTACGNPLDDVCTNPDMCNGAGLCDAQHEPPGTACGETGRTCIADDSCNGGVCVLGTVTSPCTVHGVVRAGSVGVPDVLVEVIGGDSATTDADGGYDLDIPVQSQFLMHVGDTTGYWGFVRLRRFEPAQLTNGLASSLTSDTSAEGIAQEVTPAIAVDRARGVVQVNFVGDAAGDGEEASLSAASADPIMFVPPDSFEYGTENNEPEGFMTAYNVTVGTTSVTPVDGAGNSCSLTYTPPSGWPVFAHTVTIVPVQCD
jgi:hypothetical protein